MKNLILGLVAITMSISAVSQSKDVVDIAIGSPDHTTLVAAIKAADLVTTLKSAGPFTVFAPTNAAFDKLPAGTLASLLKPESKAQLAKILTYHVVLGNVLSTSLENGEVGTLSGGKKLTINLSSGVKINDSEVVVADIQGSNGVVHVINKVLIPE